MGYPDPPPEEMGVKVGLEHRYQCSLGAAACYLRFMLTRATLMPRRCFKGFRKEVWPVPGGGNLTFRGIKNFDATIEWALKHGLDKATEFALTGGSAGRNKQPPLATENLLEDTDGLRRAHP